MTHDACPHPSMTGIDTKYPNDPGKIWKCDVCDQLFNNEMREVFYYPKALFQEEAL